MGTTETENTAMSNPLPYATDVCSGLTTEEAIIRAEAGLRNIKPRSNTKSELRIICENTFTYFNLIFLILGTALLLVGSFKNLTFLLVALANTVIGIFQEIRAKRAVDALTLVVTAKVTVIRNGRKISLPSDQVVKDDIVEFSAGQQICADGILREGHIYVNEALLTGESVPVEKLLGDDLKSGSVIISGKCLAQLTGVGSESYAAKLSLEAGRNVRAAKSEMINSLSRLIAIVGIILAPMGVILFLKHYLAVFQNMDLRSSVEATVAALIGMIPEGLYLLTGIAIAASCLKLARRKVLVQDMNCIETLAHVDILCVDKTGTITENVMEVRDVIPISYHHTAESIGQLLSAYYRDHEPENETEIAICSHFHNHSKWAATKRIPFSSDLKWSATDFGPNGKYIVGAPEFILGSRYHEIKHIAESDPLIGCRVLLLANYKNELSKALDLSAIDPIGLIVLSNPIRTGAKDTFQYFTEQGVSIRVLSGDNPVTVSAVAVQVGIPNAQRYIDASTLKSEEDYFNAAKEYAVFGRVTPEQKQHLIKAFHRQGHTVAMTGDGVNDLLALKDADCSIAMASGSQAATQISRIVLLNSEFSAMPEIVAEGRRVINNIQRSASLFLVKNIFSFTLTLFLLFINLSYPLQAIQLTLVSSLTIGIPAFFLALEPNYSCVKGKFLRNVIFTALPGGLTDLVMLISVGLIGKGLHWNSEVISTVSVCMILIVGFITLFRVCFPFTTLRRIIFITLIVCGIISLLLFRDFFELVPLNFKTAMISALLALSAPIIMQVFLWIFKKELVRSSGEKSRNKKDP